MTENWGKSMEIVEEMAKPVSEQLKSTQENQRKPYEEPTVVFVPLEALKDIIDCPMSLNCM